MSITSQAIMKSCYQLIKDILVCEKTFAFMYLSGTYYNNLIIFKLLMTNTIYEIKKTGLS